MASKIPKTSLAVHTTVFCIATSMYSGSSTSWYMNELTPFRIMVTLAVKASSLTSRIRPDDFPESPPTDWIARDALCAETSPAPMLDVRIAVPWPSMSCDFFYFFFVPCCERRLT